jgi:hypothetical protein
MAKIKFVDVDEVPKNSEPKAEETEAEMIARIKAGNGDDDEYVDKYKKDFPY